MENYEIIDLIRLAGSLMELHDENPFKVRGFQNAAFNLEKCTTPLSDMSLDELSAIEGVGKSFATKIHEINTTGSFTDLKALLEKTPEGVITLFSVKGIGPKKIKTLWKDLNITSKEALLQACEENKIAGLKGFGEKTQDSIKQSLLYETQQQDKFMYAEVEEFALELEKLLQNKLAFKISISGQVRKKDEIVDTLQFIAGTDNTPEAFKALEKIEILQQDQKLSGPFAYRGKVSPSGIKIEIKFYPEKEFGSRLYINSSSEDHIGYRINEKETVLEYLQKRPFSKEEDIFTSLNLPFIVPELREGYNEWDLAKNNNLPNLITYQDLKGTLHNHSTYSDGVHSLEEMALFAKEIGLEYLGISDHSKTAFYANGLFENRVKDQHKEIDLLNEKLAPFKILKGIESDILNDGELDYDDNVLASFDFIVASIHSNLKMTKDKATLRLIKAIENPYTTMLGHATGRLLLKREGYPIDHKKVIDACAENNVIIEINANPRRLDMEWKWVRYAIEKGIMISINPDAHEKQGYYDMHYGVHVARKAGLTKEMTFNALSLQEVENYLKKKKQMVKADA